MFFKTTILVLLMMQWKFQDITAEAQDIDSKLTELSNNIKQLAKQFEKNAKTTEDTMLELRGEENFQLSILTGQQRALENKMDVVRNNQDVLNKALGQLRQNQDEMKQELSQLRPNQNVIMQGQSHMTQTQDEMKKGLSEVKLTQDEMKQGQSHMKLTQNEMKQGQSHMKLTQDEMKKGLSEVKLTQDKTKQGQSQMKLTQDEMRQEQSKVKLTQDEDHIKINFIFEAIKKLPCELSLPSLKTQILNNKRYYVSFDEPKMSWPEADKFCKSHGMDLVSVETQEEWDALKPVVGKLSNKIDAAWSSGSDAAQDGKWKWTTTGTDVTFFGGQHYIANKAGEYCLYLYIAGWGDYPCSHRLPFICEQNTYC